MGGQSSTGSRDRHRVGDRRNQRAAQFVEQQLLQRAAGQKLGRVRFSPRILLRPCNGLHFPCGLSALPQPVAPDPLAPLAHADLSREMARRAPSPPAPGATGARRATATQHAPTTTECSGAAIRPITLTSASPKTSSNSSMRERPGSAYFRSDFDDLMATPRLHPSGYASGVA